MYPTIGTVPKYKKKNIFCSSWSRHYKFHLRIPRLCLLSAYWTYLGHVIPNTLMIKLTEPEDLKTTIWKDQLIDVVSLQRVHWLRTRYGNVKNTLDRYSSFPYDDLNRCVLRRESVNRRRTDNTMAKRKSAKEPTTIYKTYTSKLKIK